MEPEWKEDSSGWTRDYHPPPPATLSTRPRRLMMKSGQKFLLETTHKPIRFLLITFKATLAVFHVLSTTFFDDVFMSHHK